MNFWTRNIREGWRFFAPLLCALLVGCGTEHALDRGRPGPLSPEAVVAESMGISFGADIQPLLEGCIGCHGGGAGGWTYSAGMSGYMEVTGVLSTCWRLPWGFNLF